MIMPGCVVKFNNSTGVVQCGQVVRIEHCEIEIKILNKIEFAVIRNWCKACLSGKLTVVYPANTDNLKKTIAISLCHSEASPNMFDRVNAFMNGCKYVLDKKINKWVKKSLASGTLYIDGWFIPYSGQHVTKPIYFEHHNKIKHLLNQDKTSIPCFFNNQMITNGKQ